MTMSKKEESLLDESMDIEFEIIDTLENLIRAKWDSNTLKGEIESNIYALLKVRREISDLEE
jgi:hypothetical protein